MVAANITRLTAVGNIGNRPGVLHWLIISNSSPTMRHCTLHDATSGVTGEVIKFYIPGERTVPFYFDPPLPFKVGIRFGNIEHSGTIITAGHG